MTAILAFLTALVSALPKLITAWRQARIARQQAVADSKLGQDLASIQKAREEAQNQP